MKRVIGKIKLYHLRRIFVSIFAFIVILIIAIFILGSFLNSKKKVSSTDFSSELEERVFRTVGGYPIKEMAPYISKQNKIVAAFLVAIAKKESDWGKSSPQKDGKNCYNYWGYRGTYNQTDSGYSCFDSPEQAVEEVGERISEFVERGMDTPRKMVIAWKCGFDCSGHSFWSVKKWEWDVGYYFKKIYND
ncbi:MAG: hypothetical protein V1804_01195 [Patescibacteria group bacterium]